MIILFCIGILLGAVAVVFILQNTAIVTVSFFSMQFESSLAITISMALLAGAVIVLLIILPESIANYFRYRKLVKENKVLSEELRKQKEINTFHEKSVPSHEEITKIEDGAIDSH